MRVIIIDDELPSLNLLKRLIGNHNQLELVGTFTNAKEALSEISSLSPDAVFADVEMPFLNGMELAGRIHEFDVNIQIVFVTAYEKYAVEAFKVSAVNYILKPPTEDDINITVNRLVKAFHSEKNIAKTKSKNRITVLGGLELYGASAACAIRWPTAKVQELFACFVSERDVPLEKWKLCERLWSMSTPEKAEHNLHSAINRMRGVLAELGSPDILNCEKSRYQIDLSGFSCDLWELETFFEENPQVSDENITSFETILGLYKGDLFGINDFTWCLDKRELCRCRYVMSIKSVGQYYFMKKNYDKALIFLKKAAQTDPFDEQTARFLLRTYAAAGDRRSLVACYENLVRILNYELSVLPRPETSSLYKKLLGQF